MRKSHAEDHHQQRSHFVFAVGLVVFGLVYLYHADLFSSGATMQRAAGSVHEFVFDEQPCQERPCPVACHAGTLVELSDGSVLTAWFGGSAEGARDVSIMSARRLPSGVWSTPRRIARVLEGFESHWNPVLFFNADRSKLWLHFKVGNDIPLWQTWVTYSTDEGATWPVPPKPLVDGDEGGRGCVKNKPLLLDGAIICGASTELVTVPVLTALADAESHQEEGWHAFVDVSEDGGETFTRSPNVAMPAHVGVIQPTLWESNVGVHMMLRSNAGHIYRADSSDMGRTFGIGYPTDLPNGNSGIDVTKLAGGVLVLAMNPRRSNWGERYPLRLTLSTDNGRTWPTHLDVESEPGEYSYPAIIPWADGNGVHLIYTWRRSKMRYFSASLKELQRRSETTDWEEFEDRRKK